MSFMELSVTNMVTTEIDRRRNVNENTSASEKGNNTEMFRIFLNKAEYTLLKTH